MDPQLAQCECDPAAATCTIGEAAQCAIDDATGDYRIMGGSDVVVRSGSAVYTVDSSTLTLRDGEATFVSELGSRVMVDGGTVPDAFVQDSSVAVSGGMVGELRVLHSGLIEVGGGTVYQLGLYETSSVAVSDGTVVDIKMMDSASAAFSGGRVSASVYADGESTVVVDGGTVERLLADEHATVTVKSGTVPFLYPRGNARVTLRGGSVTYLAPYVHPYLQASLVIVIGTGFNYPYGLLDVSTFPLADDGTNRQGVLTGTLANGDAIDAQLFVGEGATVFLCKPNAFGECRGSYEAFIDGFCSPDPAG